MHIAYCSILSSGVYAMRAQAYLEATHGTHVCAGGQYQLFEVSSNWCCSALTAITHPRIHGMGRVYVLPHVDGADAPGHVHLQDGLVEPLRVEYVGC